MTAPFDRNEEDDRKGAKKARAQWITPALTRISAGEAENAFPSPDEDGDFTFS